jgi:hypothetical protein
MRRFVASFLIATTSILLRGVFLKELSCHILTRLDDAQPLIKQIKHPIAANAAVFTNGFIISPFLYIRS